MTAKELIEILESMAHNASLDLDELHVEVRDCTWYQYIPSGYHIDGTTLVLECDA